MLPDHSLDNPGEHCMKSIVSTTLLCAALAGCTTLAETDPSNSNVGETAVEPTQPSRLFLQQVGSDSAIVKWRGAASRLCLAAQAIELSQNPRCIDARDSDGDHREVLIDTLAADTDYYYAVGGYRVDSYQFRTAPVKGSLPADGRVHVWLLGDSGTATEQYGGRYTHPGEAQQVLDGFVQYNNAERGEALDLILLLGDNAYTDGTDAQWQGAVFDLYREQLSGAALWPTIGNHEMGVGKLTLPTGTGHFPGGSTSANPNDFMSRDNLTPRRIPYLDIFTLPTAAEVGGVPSGSEQYYAFDYGNVHFVSLDSQLTARDDSQRLAMKQWLISDLSSNQLDWTVVIFHHPPYTRGSHDSDSKPASLLGIDQPIIDMRVEFTPIFEDYGVDFVYGGHSHSYERSYYLNGHTGDADSFDAGVHAELTAAGAPAKGYGEESYPQSSANSQQDDKVVYTVAGSSGKVSLHRSGRSDGELDHPAHIVQPLDAEGRHGLAELGSVVLDAEATTLTARFINERGEVMDIVVIRR